MNITAHQIGVLAQSDKHNLLVANALRSVVENFFAIQSNTFICTIISGTDTTNYILQKLFVNLSFIAVQFIVLDNILRSIEATSNGLYHMIAIDSFKSLEKANIVRYKQNSDSLEYYLIFLQAYKGHINHEMDLIFRYCYDNYILNCNIMIKTPKGEVQVYTYFPFKDGNCFYTQPELINQFRNNSFVNPIIYPNKLLNLQKCPMKLSTWHTPPFVADATNKRFPKLNATGFEMITLTEIGQKMNFSVVIEWISYNKNQSQEAVLLQKLIMHETNITMGIFRRTTERDKIATGTFVTYYVPIIPIVLRKVAAFKSIGILTFPFDHTTWILMLIFYIFMGIINIFQMKNIKKGIFDTFEIVIGGNNINVPKKASTRIRFITTILSSFILRSVYQSLLFVIFRTNFYLVPPFSLTGLAHEGYQAVATEVTSEFLLQVPEIANNTLPLIVTNSTSEMSPMRYMEFHHNESLVVMSINEFALRYVWEELAYGTVLRILPIDIKEQQICFYFPKHSYLIERFNDYILRLHASGLLEVWKLWANSEFKVTERNVSPSDYNKALIINLKQFGGFLKLIVILHVISFIIFFFEILSIKFKWLRKFL